MRKGDLNARDDEGDKVAEKQAGKDLLHDRNTVDAVERVHGNTVFEEKEGGFDPPSELIKLLELRQGKRTGRQVCDQILKGRTEPDPDKAKRQGIRTALVIQWDKIERDTAAKRSVRQQMHGEFLCQPEEMVHS